MKPKSVLESWSKEFDEKFPYLGVIIEENGRHYGMNDIKQFISNLLKQREREVREEIFFDFNSHKEELDRQVKKAKLEIKEELLKNMPKEINEYGYDYNNGLEDCKKVMEKVLK